MLAVEKFVFRSDDFSNFFEVLSLDERDVIAIIKAIPSVNKDHKVVSDALNLVSVYMIHKIMTSRLPSKLMIKTATNVLNYHQYRFIASAINHYLPHGANYDIMQTVMERLSLKYSIKQDHTWKKVTTNRSTTIISKDNIHYNTVMNFNDDAKVLYLITDTSTRIRSQLQNIVGNYLETKEADDYMKSFSRTTTLDGEKILKELNASFSHISSAVYNKILSKSQFVNEGYIKMVNHTIPMISYGMLKRAILVITDVANIQVADNESEKVITKRNGTIISVGLVKLIDDVVYSIYDSAIHNKSVNVNSKIAIYTNTKKIYSVYQKTNNDLTNNKLSIEYLITDNKITRRSNTISLLIVALSLYICLVSFESL
jgi:hypothetical protein